MGNLDILMIFPPTTYTPHLLENRTASCEEKLQYDVPTGAVQIASAVECLGGRSKVIELDSRTNFLDYTVQRVKEDSPRYIGLSCMFNIQIPSTQKIIQKLEEEFPNLPLLIGGNAATYYPEEFNGKNVISKKGEKEIVNILFDKGLKDFQTNWKLFEVNGDISDYQFFPIYAMGCNFNCGFCSSHDFWGKQNFKEISSFRKELETLYEIGVREVCIGDETLYFDEYYLEMFDDLEGMRFIAETRADVIEKTDIKELEICKNKGLDEILIGAESGSEKVLDLMNKKMKPEQIIKATRKLKKAGCEVDTLWVLGFPGSRLEEDKLTVELIEYLYKEGIQDRAFPHIYRPFKGTNSYKNKEIKIINNNFSEWNFTGKGVKAVHELALDGNVVYSASDMEKIFREIMDMRKKYEKRD